MESKESCAKETIEYGGFTTQQKRDCFLNMYKHLVNNYLKEHVYPPNRLFPSEPTKTYSQKLTDITNQSAPWLLFICNDEAQRSPPQPTACIYF